MGEVIELELDTTLEVTPAKVLGAAIDNELTSAMVLGWDKNGQFYIASSSGDVGELLILLELGKRETLDQLEVQYGQQA